MNTDFFQKKNLVVIILSAVVIILLALIAFFLWRGLPGSKSNQQRQNIVQSGQGEDAAKETQKLLDEAEKIAEKEIGKPGAAVEIVTIKREKNGTTTEEKAAVIGFESSPISLETGDVLTKDGEKVKIDVGPGEIGGPRVSDPIDPATLPESTFRLTMTQDSIIPKAFKVKANQAVSMAVVNNSQTVNIFRFDSPLLSAVVVGLYADKAMTISFNAPSVPGEYTYYSERFRSSGAEGKMIVE
jgi:hypothetical protein